MTAPESAAHPPPPPVTGHGRPLEEALALYKGLVPALRYRANFWTLAPGDSLVFYTVGLVESRDADSHGTQRGTASA